MIEPPRPRICHLTDLDHHFVRIRSRLYTFSQLKGSDNLETQLWDGVPSLERASSASSVSSSPKSLQEATGGLIGSPSYAPSDPCETPKGPKSKDACESLCETPLGPRSEDANALPIPSEASGL